MRLCCTLGIPSFCLLVMSCSAGSGAGFSGAGGASGAGGFVSGSGGAGAVIGSGGVVTPGSGGGFIDNPGTGGGTSTGLDGGCSGVVDEAEKRVGGEADIIWVLDNSGSMFDESSAVQANLNNFSTFITNTGIDVRVVVVSSTAPLLALIPPYGVCIGPPIGSGQCPNDSTFPNGPYLHVLQEVDSHNALEMLQGTYSQWEPVIRPNSTKTFVVVTDDEANALPGAQGFIDWVNAQAKFQGALWRFSGIYCMPGAPAGINCSGTGNIYHDLVMRTGGVGSHMGAPDWNLIFQQLGDAVVADAVPVDCEWTIPPPPNGETLDPNLVNVRFTDRNDVTHTIYGVADVNACTTLDDPDPSKALLGWYYDNNVAPTRVIACPNTCPVIQADDEAKIKVEFGCEKEEPPRIR